MSTSKEKISTEDINIQKLNESHISILRGFKSYEQELINFLIEDALNNQNQKISVTFLWIYENNLVGYITLLNDKINLEGNLKEYFREKEIPYKSLPALKVGKLCVHDNYLRRGIGKLMLKFATQQANKISETTAGCRFITLDAKRNEKRELDSIHFYKKFGFEILKERHKGTTPMYLDLVANVKFCI
jgi:GNAT superfamily N-acetyltransferase